MIDFSERSNVLDVSGYPHLNDLMMISDILISDILISDYSSVFFDYSILHRPMICFAYDFDECAALAADVQRRTDSDH